MTVRELFEKELARFNKEQLESIVKPAIDERLDHITMANTIPRIVTELLNELEKDQLKIIRFLIYLKEFGPSTEIRGTAINYLGEMLGKPVQMQNPYTELIIFGEPFADRQSFRDKLKLLFNAPYNRALATNGPRYCGRSHSRILVRHVGQQIGINVVYIDLLNNTVEEIINQLINEMQLVIEKRDPLAQDATKTKDFLARFRGISQNQFLAANTRCCIVFDHHDLAETLPAAKEFAELMIRDQLENSLRNVWVVMLGLGNCTQISPGQIARLLSVDLLRIEPADIEAYINELRVKKNQQPMDSLTLQNEKQKILNGLALPLQTIDGMMTMSERLRQYF
jgi:hypothetical protein